MSDVKSNTDMSMDDWKLLSEAVPKLRPNSQYGPIQMPCNWSADDLMNCMVNEMDMSMPDMVALLKDRDLVYAILAQFQENLATHDWTEDMVDAVKHCLEEHEKDESIQV